MRFPWVSRALYEEVVRQRDELKRERNHWVDAISLQNWKVQIHDSISVAPVAEVTEAPAEEPPQSTEEEMQQSEQRRDTAELMSRMRTRRSTVPAFIQQVYEKRLMQKARAAVTQDPKPEIAARFEKIKSDTLKSIH